jgi:hypothetical protein
MDPSPQKHPVFKVPDDPKIRIWRYMDFTKFVSMLDLNSLYFSRSDLLGDSFEGSFPRQNVLLRPIAYKEIEDKYKEKNLHVVSPATGKKMTFIEFQSYMHEWLRKWTFVSCWHINEHESAALWKIYSSSHEAIAIQSRFELLRANLPSNIFIGEVIYIDYDNAVIPENNTMWPFVHKRTSFSHERELRALFQDLPVDNNSIPVGKINNDSGKGIAVNLDSLIENVYVSPSSQIWFRSVVESVMRKYGLEKEIRTSSLDAGPLF